MTAFLALVRKDLRVFFQDRRAVIMSFAAPIMIGSFFGYVFGGTSRSSDPGQVKVLFVDQEQGAVAKTILAKLSANKTLAVQQHSLEEAEQLVRTGKAPAAVIIPPDFGIKAKQALFSAQERPKIRVYLDPSHQMESTMIEGMLTGYIMEAVSKDAFAGSGRGNGLRVPFEMTEEKLTARRGVAYNPYAHSFGGMAIQFILFMGIDVGIGMLLDRQRGLWKRFAAAPLSKWTLLGSRAVSATLIAMLILTVVFAFARIVFGVKIEGSLAGFLAIAAGFGLMTSAYGLLIAALGKTPQAARGLSVLATLFMVMLSGAWVPSFLFPGWLQNATKLVPARWAMDGLDGMTWRGLGWQEAVVPVVWLVGFALLFGTIAVMRFRWEGE